MRKLLILTSKSEQTVAWAERERYVKEFAEMLQTQLENFKVIYTTYQDLQFLVYQGTAKVFDDRNQLDLKTIDLVHFKNWMFEIEEAATLAEYLKKQHVAFFNSEVNIKICTGKIAQMFRLAQRGLPVPDTFYAHKQQLLALFESGTLPEGFSFPMIMKANDGSKGDDNYLVKDATKAIEILSSLKNADKEYLLQNFIPNDGDYRFLFIGLDSEPIIFKRTAETGSHLNNTSKGGTGQYINYDDLPKRYVDDAKKAAEVLDREISGVDIIIDKVTGKHYVLEVNATPALATGYGLDVKLNKFADFVERTIDVFEED